MNGPNVGLRKHLIECAGLAVALVVAFTLPATTRPVDRPTPAPVPHWAPVTPGLATPHGADLSGYDRSCIARVEVVDAREVVTMVACPDGRVAWFG